MGDIEMQRMVAAHEEAICGLKSDIGEIKADLKQITNEALKRWPPLLAASITLLCSLVTGLGVYLLTH